ncbi:MAG TPA: tRNA pseudouridine(55) synthase TruB [Halothiobacillaceae bacterium]|nr:tRNA pseudouridine(55) synthase TruB [Halothiobacillaceae bacterium]
MGRRSKGAPIHGWVVLDKPSGMTSTAAVGAVRRRAGAAKAGHAGTLDPLATGVLPIALGEATKTVPFLVDARKCYRFTVRWGVATTTDDAEGTVQEASDNRPERSQIEAALPRFIGAIRQTPPAFSAIHVAGRRAYDLARQGTPPELPPRTVFVATLRLMDIADRDHATFEAECGKGTYVRSLARDLARELGTLGHLVALRRTRVGPFGEDRAISLDELGENGQSAPALRHLLPVETALDDIPALAVTDREAGRLRNGQTISLLRKTDLDRIGAFEDGDTVLATTGGQPVALTRYAAGEIRPFRVLNL